MALLRFPLFGWLPSVLVSVSLVSPAGAQSEASESEPVPPTTQEQAPTRVQVPEGESDGEEPSTPRADDSEALVPLEQAATPAPEDPSADEVPTPEAIPPTPLEPGPPLAPPRAPSAEHSSPKPSSPSVPGEPASKAATPVNRGSLLVELDGGLNLRLEDTAGLRRARKFGGAYTLGLWGILGESVMLGLELQHTELGGGTLKSGLDSIERDYAADTAWLSGRFSPLRGEHFLGFLALRAGVALARVTSAGVRQEATALEPARGFRCSERDSPNLALGGGIGARFGMGRGLSVISRLDGTVHRLSSAVVEGCAPGAGSSTSVSLALGLAYEL